MIALTALEIQKIAAWIVLIVGVPYLCWAVRPIKRGDDDDFDPDGMGTT